MANLWVRSTNLVAGPSHFEVTVVYYNERISVVVSRDPEIINVWIADTERIYGLDPNNLIIGIEVVHWPTSFGGNAEVISTLQLCLGDRCLIYLLNHVRRLDIPQELFNFLDNSDYTFITRSNKPTIIRSLWHYYEFEFGRHHNFFELGELACLWIRSIVPNFWVPDSTIHDTSRLANIILRRNILSLDWVITMTNQETGRFINAQVMYAVVMVYVTLEVGRFLVNRLITDSD